MDVEILRWRRGLVKNRDIAPKGRDAVETAPLRDRAPEACLTKTHGGIAPLERADGNCREWITVALDEFRDAIFCRSRDVEVH
jgi:hypothetical protein